MSEIRIIKGAKSLKHEVVSANGTVYARVISLPLAEKIQVLVDQTDTNAQAIIENLKRSR